MASSLSPFALVEVGLFPDQIFFLALMPLYLLYIITKTKFRINPIIAFVLFSQIIVFFLVFMIDGFAGHLKAIGTLLSIGIISVFFRSYLLDIRSFVRIAVLFTLVVLLLSAVSTVLAYVGYFRPIPLFDRGNGEIVYRVGYTISNTVYPAGWGYFIRPGGVFIESGQLAMYTALAIIANAVVLNNHKYERLLIFLGLFTASLGFFVYLLAFLILFRRWKMLGFFVGSFLLALLLFGESALPKGNIVAQHTLGRVDSFFTVGIGGNRAAATQLVFSNLGKLPLLGSANDSVFRAPGADATILSPFLRYGIVGGIFPYLHILLFIMVPMPAGAQSKLQIDIQKNMFAIFILLMLSLFHRPFTLHFLYYIYLIALFEWEMHSYYSAKVKSG